MKSHLQQHSPAHSFPLWPGLARLMLALAVLLWPLGGLITPVQAASLDADHKDNPPGLAPAASTDTMLQFKSGGHILGFQSEKAYLAALDHALSVEFVGAAGVTPQSEAGAAVDGQGIPALGRITYANLWPGISVSFEAQTGSIAKSTYIVASRADPSQIRLRYNVPAEVQPDGSLRFTFGTGSLTESAPLAWQEIDGQRIPVSAAFHSLAGSQSEIGFALGAYNPDYPLTIDPDYVWHTFYGSSDVGWAMTVDASGNIYVTGDSFATWDGPGGVAPLHAYSGADEGDMVVVKLNSSGVYQWHTFYGNDTAYDAGRGIALDTSGNVYIVGTSEASWNGPGTCTTPGVSPCPLNDYSGDVDIVVLKLDSSGAYQWHTFYGSDIGTDSGWGITLGPSNDI